jgi:hypothetical protein
MTGNELKGERIMALKTRTMTGYRQHTLARAQTALASHYGKKTLRKLTLDKIKADQVALRAHPGLEKCDMGKVGDHVHTITLDSVTKAELKLAETVKLGGEEIVEDAAAGEATRLGLGTKYLLSPERLVEALWMNNIRTPYETILIPVPHEKLAPISLGVRHKLQFIYDLTNLAATPQFGTRLNPREVLKSQHSLTVLNEETQLGILREVARYKHFGLSAERTLFVVQEKGLGMNIRDGELFFDPRSEFRLWNHGDMKVQETLENKVFWVRLNSKTGELEKHFIAPEEMEGILGSMRNLISYPIEDLDYLTGSINLANLAVALRLGKAGYRMTMEAVAQSTSPQKGGFFTFDPSSKKVVLVETDSGGNVVKVNDDASLARITHLNRNFNMFPNPLEAFQYVAKSEMPLHLTIKGEAPNEHLYNQSPQGDQNFGLKSAVIMWQPMQTIRALKKLEHGAPTLEAMKAQDAQPGFLDLAREAGVLS